MPAPFTVACYRFGRSITYPIAQKGARRYLPEAQHPSGRTFGTCGFQTEDIQKPGQISRRFILQINLEPRIHLSKSIFGQLAADWSACTITRSSRKCGRVSRINKTTRRTGPNSTLRQVSSRFLGRITAWLRPFRQGQALLRRAVAGCRCDQTQVLVSISLRTSFVTIPSASGFEIIRSFLDASRLVSPIFFFA